METPNQQHKCNHCGRGYARKDGLKRHEKSSKCGTLQQQPTTCEICGSPLLHETLRDHCINYHSVYTTPICEDFAQICNPNKWLKPRKCPFCDKFFIHDPKLQSHISLKHSAANQVSDIKTFNKKGIFIKQYFPFQATSEFGNIGHKSSNECDNEPVTKHQRTKGPEPFYCNPCGATFRSSYHYNLHLNMHNQIKALGNLEVSSVNQQSGGGLIDNAVPGPSNSLPQYNNEAQQAIQDLHLETINFDDDDDDVF